MIEQTERSRKKHIRAGKALMINTLFRFDRRFNFTHFFNTA